MSGLRISSFVLLLSAFSLTSPFALAQPAKIVTFATDQERIGGFLVDLTTAAFKKVGYETRITFVSWARAVAMANDGDQVDGLLGCYYSDERAEKFLLSDQISESPMLFFALESAKISYTSLGDLSKYTIGTIGGAVYPRNFAEASFLHKEPVPDFALNIRKLWARRIDLFVEKKYVVLAFLATAPSPVNDRVIALDPPLIVNKVHNAFSRTAPDAAEKVRAFNKGLRMIRDEGLYDEIIRKDPHE